MTAPTDKPPPLSQLAIHTITNKPWSLRECVDAYASAGIGGISVWREVIEPIGVDEAARILRDSGLRIPALVRGGFFVHPETSKRRRAIDTTRRCLEEAATIGAGVLVLVPGAHPQVDLATGRSHVRDAIETLITEADSHDVRLALEPLHPMYAGSRSCVNTLAQAREMCAAINHERLGVAVDVYHVWWDDALESEIESLGREKRLFAFHVNDWLPETNDLLLDRGLMGEGCIPIRRIRRWMEAAGFDGSIEVEVLSRRWWAFDQGEFLSQIVGSFQEHV